jgi:K+-sensing histidine kinase KdpD
LDNAARYARTTVSASVQENGPWVVVTVGDDGPGIPPDDRERVFERFARLQEGRSRDQGGTGLGLALSRRVAESHGGRIQVESSPLGGAAFVVSLPSSGWTGSPRIDDASSDHDGMADDAASSAAGGAAGGAPDSPVGQVPTGS